MTSADPEEIVTTAREDVVVEKSFEPDDFPVPAIAFTLRSERDTAVSVRLVDTVPDDVSPENIGFHPKYGAEFWDVEDGRIVFQRELAPGEEYTTVYGLRGGDADTAAKFMSEPTLESVDPSGSDDDEDVDAALDAAAIDGIGQSDDAESGDDPELAASDEPEELPGSDVPAGLDGEEATALDDLTDSDESIGDDRSTAVDDVGETATEQPAPETTDGRPAADSSSDDDPAVPDHATEASEDDPEIAASSGTDIDVSSSSEDGTLVSKLVAELEDGDVDDEELMVLRDALGLDFASASVEARIEHLQSEMSDLQAYTDALESFLDEEGDAQTLIEETRDSYEETTDRLGDLEAEIESVRSDLDERLDSIEATIDDRIDAKLESVSSELETLEQRFETETDARDDLEADVERLSEEIESVAEMRDRLTNALGGLVDETSRTDPGASDDADES